jgi:hypothetical protein
MRAIIIDETAATNNMDRLYWQGSARRAPRQSRCFVIEIVALYSRVDRQQQLTVSRTEVHTAICGTTADHRATAGVATVLDQRR